jgi:hypothetical protein
MTTTYLLLLSILVMVIGFLVFRAFPVLGAYFTYRGKRLITCPETKKTEAVDVDATKAAIGELFGDPKLRLDFCSRWPERHDCGQECLAQIEADPDNCLVWNIVSNWYEGQKCVLCHKKFGRLSRFDHPPALMEPDHKTTEWSRLRPEQIREAFSTSLPVCWDCHIAESFRYVHPELVVDRDREHHHAA